MGAPSLIERARNEELRAQGLKYCPKCKQTKPVTEFHKNAALKTGRSSRCKDCIAEDYRQRYIPSPTRARYEELLSQGLKHCPKCGETKPLTEFYVRLARNRRPQSWCKDCSRKEVRRSYLKTLYNITSEVFAIALDRGHGVCMMKDCTSIVSGGRGTWHVDHDHACCPGENTCGQCVRGLLCNFCNTRTVPVLEKLFPDHPYLTVDWAGWWEENRRLADHLRLDLVPA
jgi:hypothetical protein